MPRAILLLLLLVIPATGLLLFGGGGSSVPAEVVLEPEPAVDVPEADLKALVEGNNQFAIELYKKIAETEKGNIVISPYSIASALAMAYAGARGETAEEMKRVLGLSKLGERAHPAHAALARSLRKDVGKGGQEFHVANALWGQRGLPFRDEFLRLTKTNYGAGLREVDFAGDTDGARQTINKWIGEQTREKIPELLKPTDLSSANKLVLTNALYFKADWAVPFKKEHTKDGPFHVSNAKTVTIPLMHQTTQLRYAETDTAQMVELPYAGGTFAMVVVLPKKPDDMAQVEAALASGQLGKWLEAAASRQVKLTLPKFRLRAAISLGSPLEKLGIRTAFSPAADFTGLIGGGGLQITRVVHEALLDVDEKGSEAAAATAIVSDPVNSSTTPVEINQPFVFLIREVNTGTILFVGRMREPLQ